MVIICCLISSFYASLINLFSSGGILVCTDVLSRGIDIDDVDWVIQYDPPSNPRSFVHRCGRTARQDRAGNAMVFLLPNEDCYVNFISINQNVIISSFNSY